MDVRDKSRGYAFVTVAWASAHGEKQSLSPKTCYPVQLKKPKFTNNFFTIDFDAISILAHNT